MEQSFDSGEEEKKKDDREDSIKITENDLEKCLKLVEDNSRYVIRGIEHTYVTAERVFRELRKLKERKKK